MLVPCVCSIRLGYVLGTCSLKMDFTRSILISLPRPLFNLVPFSSREFDKEVWCQWNFLRGSLHSIPAATIRLYDLQLHQSWLLFQQVEQSACRFSLTTITVPSRRTTASTTTTIRFLRYVDSFWHLPLLAPATSRLHCRMLLRCLRPSYRTPFEWT